MFPGCYFSSLQGDPSPEVILRDLDPQSKILCGLEVKTSSSSTAQWATWKCSLLSETLEHSLNCIQSILPIIFFEKSWSTKWPEIYVTFPTISFYLGTKVQKWSSILYEHICVWRLAVQRSRKWLVRGLVKFVPAVAWLFCLAPPGSCLARFTYLFVPLCTCKKSLKIPPDWFL